MLALQNKKYKLIDSHCHIHDSEYKWTGKEMADAQETGVEAVVCIGTNVSSSKEAQAFAKANKLAYWTAALHPHEAGDKLPANWRDDMNKLEEFVQKSIKDNDPKLVAIGEAGLDYYYHHNELVKNSQQELLIRHMELAKNAGLPMVFHVRDAFEDFWKIYDKYNPKGVIHSFSAGKKELDQILARPNLYVGLNGIMTFSKDKNHHAVTEAVPLSRLMLETDAPYLTPAPLRGKVNEPKNVSLVAQYLSDVRGEPLEQLADQTSLNSQSLFGI